jgi:hypothetical protein
LRNSARSHRRAHECSQKDINADGTKRCTIAMPRKITTVVVVYGANQANV